MVWHYKQYARDQASDDRGAYAEAEVAARAARVGLGAMCPLLRRGSGGIKSEGLSLRQIHSKITATKVR